MRSPVLLIALVITVVIGWVHVQKESRQQAPSPRIVSGDAVYIAMDAIGCVNERDFDDWARARSQGDQQSAAAIQVARCRWLPANERVTLLERRIMGNVQIMYRGERLWTNNAALRM